MGEVSELLGVEPHVVRYWETEFRVRPPRSPSGQRMYRRADIARFLRIKSLLYQQGFTIAGARRALQGSDPGAAEAAADLHQLRAAAERVETARARLAALRAEVAALWTSKLDG
jgi:DNA-binding transcriptional MerR regulator